MDREFVQKPRGSFMSHRIVDRDLAHRTGSN